MDLNAYFPLRILYRINEDSTVGIAVFASVLVAKRSLQDCVIQAMGSEGTSPQRCNMVGSEPRSASSQRFYYFFNVFGM